MPHNPQQEQAEGAMQVRISGAAHLGRGVGRVDGKVFMVPQTAVGDLVMARVTADHHSWAEARVVEVLEPGPGRALPRCPVYGRCGGCHLQHLGDDARAAWKKEVFRDVMARIGRVAIPDVEYVATDLYGWRCRMTLHADGRAADAGFYEEGSHRIVPPGRCPIAMEPVAALLEPLRNAAARHIGQTNAEIEVVCGADRRCVVAINQERGDQTRLHEAIAGLAGVDGVVSRGGSPRWKQSGDKTISWPTAGMPGTVELIEVDPRGFTQAHLAMNPVLVETVIAHAGACADGATVVELYAGAGNITLPLAMRGATVFATDINAPAVDAGADACMKRGMKVTHAAGQTSRVLADLPDGFRHPDVVIADPPRTGMGKDAAAIAAVGAPEVVICSCEPSALARDLAPFMGAGYVIDRVTVVDMFPSTYHMEAVITLTFQR